jgi:hypothetical protein
MGAGADQWARPGLSRIAMRFRIGETCNNDDRTPSWCHDEMEGTSGDPQSIHQATDVPCFSDLPGIELRDHHSQKIGSQGTRTQDARQN